MVASLRKHGLAFLLLGSLLVFSSGCAGVERARYAERRAALYTYPCSADEVMEKASALWTQRGYSVQRKENGLLARGGQGKGPPERRRLVTGALSPRLTRVSILQGAPGAEARDYAAEAELLALVSPEDASAIARETEKRYLNVFDALFAQGRAVPAQGLRAHHLAADVCGESVPGFLDLMARTNLAVVGEVPGTLEIPQAAGRLACMGAAAGRPVVLALELPREAQGRVDRYLDSAGTPAEQHQLLAHQSWTRADPEGRASSGILALLEQVRIWRHAGLGISVLAYGAPGDPGSAHDLLMAGPILAAREARPNDWMVVLTGNLHARETVGLPDAPDFHPLAWQLAHAQWQPLELNTQSLGGTIWSCEMRVDPGCGAHLLPPSPLALARKRSSYVVDNGTGLLAGQADVERDQSTDTVHAFAHNDDGQTVESGHPELELWTHRSRDGFDGAYILGHVTAAPPVQAP